MHVHTLFADLMEIGLFPLRNILQIVPSQIQHLYKLSYSYIGLFTVIRFVICAIRKHPPKLGSFRATNRFQFNCSFDDCNELLLIIGSHSQALQTGKHAHLDLSPSFLATRHSSDIFVERVSSIKKETSKYRLFLCHTVPQSHCRLHNLRHKPSNSIIKGSWEQCLKNST
jgi:hypothetical protein